MLASQDSTASDVADDEEEGNMFAVLFMPPRTYSSSLTSKCVLLKSDNN